MFPIEPRIREDEKRRYEEWKAKDAIMGPPPQKQLDCLYFVKKADKESKDINFEYSQLVDRLDNPIDFESIYTRTNTSPDDYDIFIDPMTNIILRHQVESQQ